MRPLSSNISILYADFGPYHVARIEALNNTLQQKGYKLYAYQFASVSDTYSWNPVYPTSLTVTSLAKTQPKTILKTIKIILSFYCSLKRDKIGIIFLPSYSPLPYFLCFLAAKIYGCKVILMCDSWDNTEKVGYLRRKIKGQIIRSFDAALVAGTPHIRYITKYGVAPNKIFLTSNVIDVMYFHREASNWRNSIKNSILELSLPKKYFLNLGRFVKKKNLGFLIESYAHFVKTNPSTAIALVIVGEGPEEETLLNLATHLNLPIRNGLQSPADNFPKVEIVFFPFQQIETTPLFFAKCEAFILPSLQEEWGLVINEAMACEVPVIVSSQVGCVEDLVIDSKTGFVFHPEKITELSFIMQKFDKDSLLSKKMGKEAFKHIQSWTPERFATGAIEAIQASWLSK